MPAKAGIPLWAEKRDPSFRWGDGMGMGDGIGGVG
jgi:hypothetical protein